MKRLGSSDSLGALMSICPSADETSPRNTHVYSREYQSMLDGLDEEGCIEESGHISEKKRRLSVDQVKALEKNFEVENKLEPERKVKLAQELGLQPRQVAVWFQNRRARWKTKQLERDYGVLKANYDNLKLNYESLQRDNETLLKEIREIKAKLNEENNLSIKEETMASDSENKTVEDSETHVAVTASDAGKDMDYTAKFNDDNGRDTVLIFPDMKDGSSDDSDSSAILNSNEENNSPNAAISSSGIVLQNNNNNNHHHHHFIMSSPQPQQQPPATSSVNCFQFSDSGTVLNNTQKGYHHHQQQQQQQSQTQFVKLEEHNFFSGEEACNFFSDEQAPTLQWYCPDQWN